MSMDLRFYYILTSQEDLIVTAMRQFYDNAYFKHAADINEPTLNVISHIPEKDKSPTNIKVIKNIQAPLHSLLKILWQIDPFIIRLHERDDPSPSLFELQILYAIAEQRAQQTKTVAELLDWWLPQELTQTAGSLLAAIGRVLDDTGFDRQSSLRLADHILSLSAENSRARRSLTSDGEIARVTALSSKSLH